MFVTTIYIRNMFFALLKDENVDEKKLDFKVTQIGFNPTLSPIPHFPDFKEKVIQDQHNFSC